MWLPVNSDFHNQMTSLIAPLTDLNLFLSTTLRKTTMPDCRLFWNLKWSTIQNTKQLRVSLAAKTGKKKTLDITLKINSSCSRRWHTQEVMNKVILNLSMAMLSSLWSWHLHYFAGTGFNYNITIFTKSGALLGIGSWCTRIPSSFKIILVGHGNRSWKSQTISSILMWEKKSPSGLLHLPPATCNK